jgi:hypothetical protein
VESSADLPASGKRRRPTVNDARNSNQEPALTKSKITSSELQDRPHHSPTNNIIDDFNTFESFSNLLDSPPTTSHSSPVELDVSSEHLRRKIISKKEPHVWCSETQRHPFDSNIQLFSWFTFHKTRMYLAKFPQSIVNTKKRLSSQDSINWEGEFSRLNFDSTAFTHHKTYKDRFHTNIEGLINNPLLLGHAEGKLMMTEDQYIEHHPKVNWLHAAIKSDDQHEEMQVPEHNEGRVRMVIGLKILLENKHAWFSHWKKHLNWRLAENPIEHIELIKPDKLGDTIAAFLFFVEMINTIVPGPQITSLGSDLEDALKILERLFNLEKIDQSDDHIRVYIFDKMVLTPSLANSIPIIWKLIGLWMETFRSDFLNKLLSRRRNLETTKAFFNTIFFHSIENLTKQIRKS